MFEAIGDWGDSVLPGQARVAERMDEWALEHHSQFVITAGDNFYPNVNLSRSVNVFSFGYQSEN